MAPRSGEHLIEFFRWNAALLSSHILNAHPEYAGPLRNVINVSPGFENLQHISALQRTALFARLRESIAIGVFILQIGGSIGPVVERKTHFVQGISVQCHAAIENNRPWDILV